MEFDDQAYLISLICTVISLSSASFVLSSYCIVKETRSNFFFNMGVYLALCDAFLGISSLNIKDPTQLSSELCNAFGFTREFSMLSSFSWTSLIAYSCYSSIKYNLSDEELCNQRFKLLALGFGPAALIAFLPVQMKEYGQSWIFCWVSSSKENYLLNMSVFSYLPFGISMIISLICFAKAHYYLKNFMGGEVSYEFYRLMMYPIISFICNIGSVVYAFDIMFYDTQEKNNSTFFTVLRYYYLISRQSQGLMTAIVYGMNYHVRMAWKSKIKRSNLKSIVSDGEIFDEDLESFERSHYTFSLQRRDENIKQFFENQEFLISKYFDNANKPKSYTFLD